LETYFTPYMATVVSSWETSTDKVPTTSTIEQLRSLSMYSWDETNLDVI
jgi:hypothetical protein